MKSIQFALLLIPFMSFGRRLDVGASAGICSFSYQVRYFDNYFSGFRTSQFSSMFASYRTNSFDTRLSIGRYISTAYREAGGYYGVPFDKEAYQVSLSGNKHAAIKKTDIYAGLALGLITWKDKYEIPYSINESVKNTAAGIYIGPQFGISYAVSSLFDVGFDFAAYYSATTVWQVTSTGDHYKSTDHYMISPLSLNLKLKLPLPDRKPHRRQVPTSLPRNEFPAVHTTDTTRQQKTPQR